MAEVDLSTVPLAPNPNGDPPNFTNPATLNPAILGVGVSLIVISLLVLVARVAANLKNNKKLGLDDYLCIFAEIGGISYWAVVYSLGLDGAARHIWDVPASIVTRSFIKRQYVQQTIIAPTLWAGKASILALYIRLFHPIQWFRWTGYALMFFMALFYGANIVVAAAYCIPRNGAPWDATAFARCASPITSAIVIGSFNVAADVVLFIMPFLVIRSLQMGRQRRWGLYIIFFVGILTVVSSVISLVYRVLIFTGTSKDSTWNGIRVSITTFAEVFGTIMVSCSTALPSFYHRFFAESRIYKSLRSTFSRTTIDGSRGRGNSVTKNSNVVGEEESASNTSVEMQSGITKTTQIDQFRMDVQWNREH